MTEKMTPAQTFDIDEHTYDPILHDLISLKASETLTDSIVLGAYPAASLSKLPDTDIITLDANGHSIFHTHTQHLSAQTHQTLAGAMSTPKVVKNSQGNYIINNTNQTQIKLFGLLHFYIPFQTGCTAKELKDQYKTLKGMTCKKFVDSPDFKKLFPDHSLNSVLRGTFGQDGTRFGVWMAKHQLLDKRYSYYPNPNSVPTSKTMGQQHVDAIFGEFPFISRAMFARYSANKSLSISNYFSALGFFKEVPIGNDSHTFWISSHLQGKIFTGELDNFFLDGVARKVLEELVSNFITIQKLNPNFADYIVTSGYNVALHRYCLESQGANWVALFYEENGHIFLKTMHSTNGPGIRSNKYNGVFDYCMSVNGKDIFTIWNDKDSITHLNQNGKNFTLYANTLKGYPSPIGDAKSLSSMYTVKGSSGKWNFHKGNPIAFVQGDKPDDPGEWGLYEPSTGKITNLIKYDDNIKDVVEVTGGYQIVPIKPTDEPYLSPTAEAPYVWAKSPIKNILNEKKSTNHTNDAEKKWHMKKIESFLALYHDAPNTTIQGITNPASLKFTEISGVSVPTQFLNLYEDMRKTLHGKIKGTATFKETAEAYVKELEEQITESIESLEVIDFYLEGMTPDDSDFKQYTEDKKKAEDIIQKLTEEKTQVKAILRSDFIKQLRKDTPIAYPDSTVRSHKDEWPDENMFHLLYDNGASIVKNRPHGKENGDYSYSVQYKPNPKYHNLFNALMEEALSIKAHLLGKIDEYTAILAKFPPVPLSDKTTQGQKQRYNHDVAANALEKYKNELKYFETKFVKTVLSYHSDDKLDIANPKGLLSYTNEYEKTLSSRGFTREEIVDFKNHTTHMNKFKFTVTEPSKESLNNFGNLKTASKNIRLATIIRLVRSLMV